jgi:hypothetical protein
MLKENYDSTKPRKLQDALDRVEDAAVFLRAAIKIARDADLDEPIQPILNRVGEQRTQAIFAIEDALYILSQAAKCRDAE